MKKLLIGLVTLPFLAGAALAGQPTSLTNQQMDKVTAGFDFRELEVNNVGTAWVGINVPPLNPVPIGTTPTPTQPGCGLTTGCFLQIDGTAWGPGGSLQSFQLHAGFGPGGLGGPGTSPGTP
jgi:hypothetical protein